MPAPSTPALDSFNAGANQLLTARAGWSASVVYTGDTSMTTDAVPTYATYTSGAESSNRWTLGAADAECWYTIGAASVSYYCYTRLGSTPPANGYEVGWTPAGVLTLYKVVNDVETSLAVIGTFAQNVGDSVCLQSIGTTQAVYYKASGGSWVLEGSATDATYTSGDTGILVGSSSAKIDVFGGGALVAAPVVQPSRRSSVRRA